MNLVEYLLSQRDVNDFDLVYSGFLISRRVECESGFSVSIQANRGAYCNPRTNIATWYEVELGFPSHVPPDFILEYAEERDRPTDTVYGYVPVELVERMLEMHGGAIWPEGRLE
jgi:hypothetical protein